MTLFPTETADLSALLRQRHLPALEGLRAVAVFVVISSHFFGPAIPGDLGVTAFFVLSGFLITWLLLKEYRTAGTVSVRNFYVRRVLRIFPAYYCFITVSYVIDYFRGHPWDRALGFSGVWYVVNYYNATHGHPQTSIVHAWSLAVEEQFYLLWPLVLLALVQRRTVNALAILAAIIAAVAAWRSFLYLDLHVGTAYVYNAFDTRFDDLAVGCFLAFCASQSWFLTFARAVSRSAALPIVTLALLIFSRFGISSAYHYSLGFTVDALLVMVLLVQVLLQYRHPMWSWLQHPVVRYLGIISYPLYLWHAWALDVGRRLHVLPVASQLMVGVASCIVVATGSYFLIEKPFLALKERFSPLPPVGLPTAASVS
jgi:peptidoglycan/LPS O-acetylase OafA/YrhL